MAGIELPVVQQYSAAIGRTIDNTALNDYQTCPRKYYFGMVLHRRSNDRSAALNYGTMWHTIMEAHYKGHTRALIHALITGKYANTATEGDYRTAARALLEYDNYVAQYGDVASEERAGAGKTLGVGNDCLVELPVELNLTGVRHPYAGKIDRLYEKNGLYYVEDHKTTSVLNKNYFTQWTLAQQMKGYAILGQLLIGKPIAGVRINLHVCRKSDSEFLRDVIPFSQAILDETQRALDLWMWRIETSAINAANGDIEAAYPPNFNACSGKYSMCQYAGVCSLSARVRMKALETDFPVHAWNPLEVNDE
jgi:PD-(D/E)XK nuclease superfamily protein